MSLYPHLYLGLNGTGDPRDFVRINQVGDSARYFNMASIESTTRSADELIVRASTSGQATSPSTYKKRHNLVRTLSIVGADGKIYTGQVSLTTTLPGGTVFNADHLTELLGDVLNLATNYLGADNPTGAVIEGQVSEAFVDVVRTLQV